MKGDHGSIKIVISKNENSSCKTLIGMHSTSISCTPNTVLQLRMIILWDQLNCATFEGTWCGMEQLLNHWDFLDKLGHFKMLKFLVSTTTIKKLSSLYYIREKTIVEFYGENFHNFLEISGACPKDSYKNPLQVGGPQTSKLVKLASLLPQQFSTIIMAF